MPSFRAKHITYLDHAATSWPKPPEVAAAMADCMSRKGGNPGRGAHRLSLAAAKELYRCREVAAELFGSGHPENVIFTMNTTQALNLVIKGILSEGGGHALCSDMEHNAVYRPLCRLREEGCIQFDVFDTFPAEPHRTDGDILRSVASRLRPDTRLLVAAHASNICSASLPIHKLGELCRRRGIPFVVDGAQSAGILPIHMERMGIDALCIPGHKGLMGPQGVGMLILGESLAKRGLSTLVEGGNGVDSLRGEMSAEAPERYEAGTLPTPAVAGLRAGIEWVRAVGLRAIREREVTLAARLREGLLNTPGVKVYAPHHEGGVVLFSVEGRSSEEVAALLDGMGVCVRPGFHCSALGHRTLGTPDGGAVRVSFGYTNRERDVEAVLKGVRGM